MVGFTLCSQEGCPLYGDCYRNPKRHRPVPWQSCFTPEYTENGCEDFIPTENVSKERKEDD